MGPLPPCVQEGSTASSPFRRTFFDGRAFSVSEGVYESAEDTFLLARNMLVRSGESVLDMGTGCGILAVLAAERAGKVVAVDVNPHAARCARVNARLHGVEGRVEVLRGDLFEALREGERFDVIVFNAPYLPSEPGEEEAWIGRAWAGGPNGREVIDRFLSRAPRYLQKGGRIYLAQSTLSHVEETLKRLRGLGMRAAVVAEEKLDFESIVVIRAELV